MKSLWKKTPTNERIASVIEAASIWQRTRGLMFRASWPSDVTLWIHHCRSIHTAFVRFPIDAVFVDDQLVVRKVMSNISPWRLPLPAWSAQSVFEFVAGQAAAKGLQEGDQLYVGD